VTVEPEDNAATVEPQSRALPSPPDPAAEEVARLIREHVRVQPEVAVVLGSGLGDAVAGDVTPEHEFAFEALPGFPPPSVPGHAGALVMGELYGVPALVFRGRIHYYEGYGIIATTLIPRVASALGVRTLILTNAAGGLDRSMRVGQLMLIEDHINLLGVNPLTGWRFPGGQPAFVDLSAVYDAGLRALAREAAARAKIDLGHGVYAGLPGPSYETKAETAFLRGAGADAVGMSTVPEAVAATALGMKVLGISLISNVAGMASSHQEVLEAGRRAGGDLRAILAHVVPRLGTGGRSGETQPASAVQDGTR
jgi:purine-nucleoside phosphorylase